MSGVRKPPVQAVFALHPQGVRGSCQWCGKEVTERTEVRGWLKLWHDDCLRDFKIVTMPDRARDAVFGRDAGVCADCGEDWSGRFKVAMASGSYPFLALAEGGTELWMATPQYVRDGVDRFQWCPITYVSLWHVDHHVPLWKVRHLPDIQRIEYFKLANLKTRCGPCHDRKSTKEGAERAHYRDLAGENKEKPKRDWGGRGFQKRAEFTPRPPRQIDKGE